MGGRVVIEGIGEVVAESGESLLAACDRQGVLMDSACGGFAACNSCRVLVLDGEAACNPVGVEELSFLDAPHQRLGCQLFVSGPVKVRLDPGM